MNSRSRLQLPVRKPTYRFALTPLADAMFQLLTFFMLSSSLTPYSLLTLQSTPLEPQSTAAPGPETSAQPDAQTPPTEVALWTVEHETLVIAGQHFGFDALPSLAAALGSGAALADVVLVLREDTQVQDVTTVLEALKGANVGSVSISTGAG